MRVAVTGATGLIGTRLCKTLLEDGAEILALTRRRSPLPSPLKPVYWHPERADFDARAIGEADAVVHLAGESIARRWSRLQKERIWRSRVEGTRVLVNGLRSLPKPPRVVVSASAVGWYGDREDEELDERSAPGTGFLADLCRAWESEVARASEIGARTVSVRIGMVLSSKGGALAKMLPAFRLGLGGTVGSGRQWVSWIHIEDIVGIFRLALTDTRIAGVVNGTAPEPVRQGEFARALGRVLARPTVLPVPGLGVKLLFGEMGERLLLEGQRVIPRRLLDLGYAFRFTGLTDALGDVLTSRK